MDEIPQFFNVLIGDLTLVGPRPERPEMNDRLRKAIPFFDYRYLVRPGITGWAQVSGEYASSLEGSRLKAQYDFFYIKNRCLFLDLVILIRTAKSVIQMNGR
jgi:lipopolysaccharide/colanic/teichoic acid biosynthesis glycosyltransferase